jgi:hypothetical protein
VVVEEEDEDEVCCQNIVVKHFVLVDVGVLSVPDTKLQRSVFEMHFTQYQYRSLPTV